MKPSARTALLTRLLRDRLSVHEKLNGALPLLWLHQQQHLGCCRCMPQGCGAMAADVLLTVLMYALGAQQLIHLAVNDLLHHLRRPSPI